MNDIELIQSAAKAAGFLYDPTMTGEDGTLVGCYRTDASQTRYVWNPLLDEEDAIATMIRVKINLEPTEDRLWAHYGQNLHLSEPTDGATLPAFCRVITRIAAEVGKQYL